MPQLHWLTRDADLLAADKVPYRLLDEVSELSCTEADPHTENMLIQGDNLDALKALLPVYAGQVKCIFIDPPYNTRSAFEHYDDNLEHTKWLAMMVPRLTLLREFLREDGSIWVTIDDNEAHYLKVVMDEVFGRSNFVANVIWQKRFSPNSTARHLSDSHDHLLVYALRSDLWQRNLLPRDARTNSSYKNLDEDSRGLWTSSDLSARNYYSLGTYSVTTPKGRIISAPPQGRYWSVSEQTFKELDEDGRIWWGASQDNQPRLKRFLRDVMEGVVPQTVWSFEEVGHTQEAKKELLSMLPINETIFQTPKPERLLSRALAIATEPDELVLDSFLGSGTTAAVAHKMGRRYIGIEMGEHAVTHCAPRLRKVIEGEQGGVSKAESWKGGGGFRFYRLGRTVFDADGNIDPAIRFAQLASHIWFTETRTPRPRGRRGEANSPLLGVHEGTAYYLLYNGVLGDRRPGGGNVLTRAVLADLPPHAGPKVIYGESCRLSKATLERLGITFKQTPYDVRAR